MEFRRRINEIFVQIFRRSLYSYVSTFFNVVENIRMRDKTDRKTYVKKYLVITVKSNFN